MSLATTIGAGALLGTVLAVGVYNVVAPDDAVPASVEVAPTYEPVPTPTVTEEAEDCVDPAVLEDDECIVHVPGPTVTVTPPAAPAPVTQAARTPATSQGSGYRSEDSRGEDHDDDGYGEDYGDHEDEGDDDHEGEYEDHDGEDHEDEYEDHDGEDHEDD